MQCSISVTLRVALSTSLCLQGPGNAWDLNKFLPKHSEAAPARVPTLFLLAERQNLGDGVNSMGSLPKLCYLNIFVIMDFSLQLGRKGK